MEFEELPDKARWVVTGYSVAVIVFQAGAVFFEAYKRELIALGVVVILALAIGGYFYVKFFFKHYRYHISDELVVVKKGNFFRRRCAIYREQVGCVTLSQGPIQRRMGLCTVWFHIPGGIVKLSYVKKDRVDLLLNWNES